MLVEKKNFFFAKKKLNNSEIRNGNNKSTGRKKEREPSDVKAVSKIINDEGILEEKLD